MRRLIIHVLMAVVGASLGITALPALWRTINWRNFQGFEVLNGLIGAFIFVIISFLFVNAMLRGLKKIDDAISKMNISKIVFNLIGTILGLLIGVLASVPLALLNIPMISNLVPFVMILVLMYVGYTVLDRRADDIVKTLFKKRREAAALIDSDKKSKLVSQILLDTSSIIDGRILDVIKTGFISDQIVIPNFVILELQLISDSSDALKRAKGRRGLDLVNQLKEIANVQISKKDYKDIREVDTKLLRYASEVKGKLVTNDFNLNKVAEIQGLPVLNINDLANAVKTQVVVGELMTVSIIREGSERQQGVGYLPDGTMIVVENTKKMIDKDVQIEVTKVLQTSAGRMIFAELIK